MTYDEQLSETARAVRNTGLRLCNETNCYCDDHTLQHKLAMTHEMLRLRQLLDTLATLTALPELQK